MRYPALTVRGKIVSSVIAVVLGFVLLLTTTFPSRQQRLLTRGLEHKATSLAKVLAYEVRVALEFADAAAMQASFKALAQDSDFVYCAIHDAGGRQLAGYQVPATLRAEAVRASAQVHVERRAGVLRAVAPIFLAGKVEGAVLLGLSLASLQAEQRAIRRSTLAVSAAILALGVGFALLLGTSLGRRMHRITRQAQVVAALDLSGEPIQDRGRDEIGVLAKTFERMLASLRGLEASVRRVAAGDLSETLRQEGDLPRSFNEMIAAQRRLVSQIAEAAVAITSAASEFVAGAQQLMQGALEQSSAVEENQRTMHALLKASDEIGGTARAVHENAQKTQRNTLLVGEHLGGLVKETGVILELLQVIDDIAIKSELLALNAALEGTRAGEAGKGFSLVASQMQQLAEEVKSAVASTKRLTEKITRSTQATVQATDETIKLAAKATTSVQAISAAIDQQQAGTLEVSEAMEGISRVARQTAAGSQQIVTSSKSLRALALDLEALVARFTLKR